VPFRVFFTPPFLFLFGLTVRNISIFSAKTMASIPKPTVKSVLESETSKKLPPSLEKFDKTDPICLFCNQKQSYQDLWEHTLNCTEYEKALSQPTCPLCKVTVKDSMTLHLYNCEVSSKYFQQMMQYQNSKFHNLAPIYCQTLSKNERIENI
jgi:hypothetical protein